VVEGVPKVMHDMGPNLTTHHIHAKVYAKSETNQISQTVIPTWVPLVNAPDLLFPPLHTLVLGVIIPRHILAYSTLDAYGVISFDYYLC
jgi:hypothetical protein